MKIGMLTSHASMNYGGLLQAYALREVLLNMDNDVEIINYKPEMHNIKEHPIQFLMQRKGAAKRAVYTTMHYKEFKNKVKITDNFKKNYLKPVPADTLGFNDLENAVKGYDVICCGSDQLWNLNQKDNENRAFMLDFPHTTKSISYAVSFGDGLAKKKDEITASLPLIRSFSHVSVRDNKGQEFLRKNGIQSCITIDPTLLIDESHWKKFDSPAIIKEPYLLVYGFENEFQKYCDLIYTAKKIAEKLNIKIVNPVMSPAIAKKEFKNFFECGPIEFYNLVNNASFVCTNSFHGTIFSIICNTPFAAVFNDGKMQDDRKKTLLAMTKLEHRAVTPTSNFDIKRLMSVDYTEAFSQIYIERKKSLDYLKEALR